MSRRTIFCNRDPLGDRLRRESRESRPEFSESLHKRIAAAIHEQRLRRAAERRSLLWFGQPPTVGRQRGRTGGESRGEATFRRRLSRLATLVAAACVALMAVGVGWQWMGPSLPVNGRPVDSGAPMALARVDVASTPLGRLAPPVGAAVDDPLRRHVAGQGEDRATVRSHLRSEPAGPPLNLDRLVCDDARRAAHVLLNRLPIDLALSDLTQIDK